MNTSRKGRGRERSGYILISATYLSSYAACVQTFPASEGGGGEPTEIFSFVPSYLRTLRRGRCRGLKLRLSVRHQSSHTLTA